MGFHEIPSEARKCDSITVTRMIKDLLCHAGGEGPPSELMTSTTGLAEEKAVSIGE